MRKKKFWLCVSAVLLLAAAGFVYAESLARQQMKIESDQYYTMLKHEVDGIHFYDVERKDIDVKKPVVILLHGMGENKEKMKAFAKEAADNGYLAVVPDAAGLGENEAEETYDFCEVIRKTAESCTQIRSYYDGQENVDAENFSMAGFSMGAMTALYYAAYSDVKPACVVSLYGTPNWESLSDTKMMYKETAAGKFKTIKEEEKKETLRNSMKENSPENNMEMLLQVPILMINGDRDSIVPYEGIREFLEKASLYPNNLENIKRSGSGHKLGEDDKQDAIRFIRQYVPVHDGV